MDQRKVDYIIVGQGMAGSWLAYELMKRGQAVHVIDQETSNTSSLKAAGLYNPITGKKMMKTWMADVLFSNLEQSYIQLEKELRARFLYPKSVYRPFLSIEEKNDWQGKWEDREYETYIDEIKNETINYPGIKDEMGGIVLKKTGYVDLPKFIPAMRNYFINKGAYQSEVFDHEELSIQQEAVVYKNIEAKKLIFCEGPTGKDHFWANLPFRLVRGEVIDIACGIKKEFIINRGVFMIPKEGHFTVGSTYDHQILSFEPQKEGIQELKRRLAKLFDGTYRIIGKRAGIRPATYDRKPFIGFHKKFKTLGIFNGFGTKGVSLTPYFASNFADCLLGRSVIEKEADVQRVF